MRIMTSTWMHYHPFWFVDYQNVIIFTQNASVLSKKLSTEDITTAYYDLEAQLESLLEQQARIEKLMDEATNFSYLLELEDKLTSIRMHINIG